MRSTACQFMLAAVCNVSFPPRVQLNARMHGYSKLVLKLCFCALVPAFFLSVALHAQTQESISVGDGTLTFNETTITQTCTQAGAGGPEDVSYTQYDYDTFVYTDANGVTTQLDGSTFEAFLAATHCSPPPPQGPNPFLMKLRVGATISFTMSGRGAYYASVSSLVDPLYKVTSILYATPGNASSDSFTDTKTNGSVTTLEHSFGSGDSETFSVGWPGGSAGFTFGASTTFGNSSAFTETLANASSISNASSTTGANTVSHNQDLLLIWLNPEVELTGTSQDIGYTLHTQYQNATAEQPDFVEVTAQAMQAINGSTNIPLSILQRQYDPASGQYDLPGLASVCVDQSQYQNNCPVGGQCGCVPSDFAGILASDPLLNTTMATNPLTVDASGTAACSLPVSGSGCRYVPVPSYQGSSAPMSTVLSGPNCVGCNRPINAFTQTDTTSTTQTFSETTTQTVGYTVKFGFAVGPTASLQTNWVWTDTERSGAINGTANQIGYSLSSSTPACYQDVLLYEDTVFHTFVTQQAPGNNSCP